MSLLVMGNQVGTLADNIMFHSIFWLDYKLQILLLWLLNDVMIIGFLLMIIDMDWSTCQWWATKLVPLLTNASIFCIHIKQYKIIGFAYMISSLQDHMRTKHKRIRLIMHLIYKGSARLLVMGNQVGTLADNSVFRMIIQIPYPSYHRLPRSSILPPLRNIYDHRSTLVVKCLPGLPCYSRATA